MSLVSFLNVATRKFKIMYTAIYVPLGIIDLQIKFWCYKPNIFVFYSIKKKMLVLPQGQPFWWPKADSIRQDSMPPLPAHCRSRSSSALAESEHLNDSANFHLFQNLFVLSSVTCLFAITHWGLVNKHWTSGQDALKEPSPVWRWVPTWDTVVEGQVNVGFPWPPPLATIHTTCVLLLYQLLYFSNVYNQFPDYFFSSFPSVTHKSSFPDAQLCSYGLSTSMSMTFYLNFWGFQ